MGSEKLPQTVTRTHAAVRANGPPSAVPASSIALQDRLGNAALARLLRPSVVSTATIRAAADDQQERDADRIADQALADPSVQPALTRQLGEVRIHTSGAAAEAARALHVQAFTIGRDIAFAPGRFAPDTARGRRLLAHELAHVDQQRAGGPRLQCKPDEDVPAYLRPLDETTGRLVAREMRFWEDQIEIAPLAVLRAKYPQSPLRDDVLFDIPAIDWEHPFEIDPKPRGKFKLHTRLPGGYELMDLVGKDKVFLAKDGIGYVMPEGVFAAMFVGQGSVTDFYETVEGPLTYRHEHPMTALAADVLTPVFFPLPIYSKHDAAFLIMGLMMPGLPGFKNVGAAPRAAPLVGWESHAVAAFDVAALGRAMPRQLVESTFGQVGGPKTGFSIQVVTDATVIETPTSLENRGLGTKHAGGAQTNVPAREIYVHQHIVEANGVRRSWGADLNLRQVTAHEVGHAMNGGGTCAKASRTAADLPGLTSAERTGLLDDAVQITRNSDQPMERLPLSDLRLPADYKPPKP